MAEGTRASRIVWFVALWCAGVGAVTAVGFVIRLFLMPG